MILLESFNPLTVLTDLRREKIHQIPVLLHLAGSSKTFTLSLRNTVCGMTNQTKAWIEEVIIPTYPIGSPEKNLPGKQWRCLSARSG